MAPFVTGSQSLLKKMFIILNPTALHFEITVLKFKNTFTGITGDVWRPISVVAGPSCECLALEVLFVLRFCAKREGARRSYVSVKTCLEQYLFQSKYTRREWKS